MKPFLITIFCMISLMSENIYASRKDSVGIPKRNNINNIKAQFATPPAGYGNVPFFWWQGDTITREKLIWQLDQMASHHTSSLQINYSHTDKGGLFWGLSQPSQPALFTDEWWNLFGWFMDEARQRGMTVSLSDYTLGVGQGFAIDEVHKEHPDINARNLVYEKILANSSCASYELKSNPLTISAFPLRGETIVGSGKTDLRKNVNNKTLTWKAPQGDWIICYVYDTIQPNSYNPMHPVSGSAYVKHFFQPFEDRFPETSRTGLNFFFSDELDFHLKGITWDERFAEEFLRRKGYDILPELISLFEQTEDRTPKIRMDYNDVFVSLSEENFFKPVYDWHQERGLIYGCDHGGRGKQVEEFGDYFRTQRWNQAPGCDQPGLGKDIIKNKVASSLSHMYNRPRVWLEGFYGSGWSTSSAQLADAIFANFVMGQNLLSLHGLYYATPGGWWEWAPPCNHYRMPYWEEMPELLACSERLSYLLSQGYHHADVAIIYPVEPVVAGYGKDAVNCAFDLGTTLYKNGIDFDFIDYESLERATVKNKELSVANENFSVLIIPSMKAIRHSSLKKALDFKRAGGTVICLGELPVATELNGSNDKMVAKMVAELSSKKVAIKFDTPTEVIDYINQNSVRDFKVLAKSPDKNPYVMHRKIDGKDYYAIYNVDQGTECFFRAKGGIELWNPWDGTTKNISAIKESSNGTYIKTPLSDKDIQIFVFDPAAATTFETNITAENYTHSKAIEGDWSFELIPTLYNKWGDFYWPGNNEFIGPMINFIEYKEGNEWISEQLSYAARFRLLQGIKEPLDEKQLFAKANYASQWEELIYSLRWGVKGDYGHQGYHGLKGEMYDDFIRLGSMKTTNTEIVREKNPDGDHCYLYTNVYVPTDGIYKVLYGDTKPIDIYINRKKVFGNTDSIALRAGVNEVLLHYLAPVTTYMVFVDSAKKGLIAESADEDRPLSMRWNGDRSILPYDISSSEEPGEYRFMSAPGLKSIELSIYGSDITAYVDGRQCSVKITSERSDGLKKCIITNDNFNGKSQRVCIVIDKPAKGFTMASAFPYPIKQICDKGKISLGDWTKIDGLRCYSGGAWYRNSFKVDDNMINRDVLLNLGEVVSTARVYINGKEVGIKMTPPWVFNISEYLVLGKNSLEIKVFNTAGNHYESIPTRYRGNVEAGILGPVELKY